MLAVPVATGDPEQLAPAKSFTVVPMSAEPMILGLLSLAGDEGMVPVRLGGDGAPFE